MFNYSDKFLSILINRAKFGMAVAYNGLNTLEAEAIEGHYTDPSTGTLRELAALLLTGAENDPGQHGYDGMRDGVPIECKPINYKGGKNNANGHGHINDHSWTRHADFLSAGLIMQQSQFFYGDCAWIVEFPYRWIEEQMHGEITHCQRRAGRIVARFSYTNWIDCPDLEVRYLNKDVIVENRLNIVGGKFYNRLYDKILSK